MNDKEQFAAQTQRHITFLLIYALLVLIFGLLIAAFLPYNANDKILAMVSPLIVGIFGLASGAVGFWIAKQRYQSSPDDVDGAGVVVARQSTTNTTVNTQSTKTPSDGSPPVVADPLVQMPQPTQPGAKP